MDVASFKIAASPFGATIEVNGQDITDQVGAAEIRVADGQPTTLTLHHIGDGTIEGQGIVQVVEPSDLDEVDLICSFLAGIDPDQLDNDALNDTDASANLTGAMLAQLQRYARGE